MSPYLVLLAKYNYIDEAKEVEMCRACSMHEIEERKETTMKI
jgi:hypothetical protein